ncbi:tricarboxylate transporter [Oceanispirochaeta crateris]|uniref:Tricarboxylate transporter n=1 Tax=Oceanispirochaeta crateris TaxID=2518645 RepID=A0A5C1QP65_9SPIO|nr:tripartite tricarboxylate transporter permease [Oceanispirochaeta crateris]QEN09471.1 tricarboxylate transporter [Oceanispirochaeta crateris]
MDQILQILSGTLVVLQPLALLYLFVGFFIGIIFGALPGLTSMLAIVLLLPMTYTMPMTYALIMCMGVYMSGIYSGSITAITISIPGAPSALMTCMEGHPLMKKGQGAKAIGHATIGSAIGGSIGALLLIFVSPLALKLALKIRTPGKFSLILFALIVIVIVEKKRTKAIISMAFGIILSTVGMDPLKSVSRFTFGNPNLIEGIDLTTLIIGAFAISELFAQATVNNTEYSKMTSAANSIKFKRKDFFPPLKEMKEIGFLTYIKSAFTGYLIGVLPGAGASMAGFVSYVEAKRTSKHPERFGKGAIDGLVASETANNAMCGGALVPMLALGIPGDGTTAIILGVLMVYGVVPGPNLLVKQMAVIAPMYMALLISAGILLPLSLFLFGPYYLKIVRINRLVLYSGIALIAILGVFAATYSVFQMGVALVIGVVMYYFKKQKYPNVPFILAVILGPLCEQYLRTSLTLSSGNPMVFITNFDSLFFILLTIAFVILLPRANRRSEALEKERNRENCKC